MARDLSKTDAWLISRRERKKVEMLSAHLAPDYAVRAVPHDEFFLAAAAQNVRNMAKLIVRRSRLRPETRSARVRAESRVMSTSVKSRLIQPSTRCGLHPADKERWTSEHRFEFWSSCRPTGFFISGGEGYSTTRKR
jgi:hypothetical protein